MEDIIKFREEFGTCFDSLKNQVDKSFEIINRYPGKKDEVVNLWKEYIIQFKSYIFEASEENQNRDIYKAVSKSLIFGR